MDTIHSFFTTNAHRVYLAGLFLLPVALATSAVVPITPLKALIGAAACIGALALAIFGSFKRGGLTLPVNAVMLSAWLIPLAYLVSTLVSPSLTISLIGNALDVDTVFFMALCALALSLPLYIFQSRKDFTTLYAVMLVSAWLLALFHLARLFFGADVLSFGVFTNPLFSPVGKWNDIAIFFGLATLLSLVNLEMGEFNVRNRWIVIATLVVSLFLLAVVNFTPVWVVLAILSLGIVLNRLLVTGAARFSVAPTVVFVIALVCVIFSSTLGGTLGRYFAVQQIEARPSWGSTMTVGTQALKANPIFGSGPNTFILQWDKYRPLELNKTLFWSADFTSGIGLIPTSLITVGLLGALAWLAFFFFFVWSGIKGLLLATQTDQHEYHLLLASFVAGLYMLIMMVVYLPSPALVILGFALIGLFASLYHKARGGKTIHIVFRERPRLGFVAVLALALVLVVSAVSLYGVGTVFASNVRFEQASRAAQVDGNLDTSVQYIDAANALNPEDRYYRLATLTHLARMNAAVNTATAANRDDAQKIFQTELGAAVESGLTAAKLNPSDYRNWQAVGTAYQSVVPLNIQGAYESAVASFNRATVLNNQMPALPLARAQMEVSRSNNDAARTYVEQAIALKEDYIPALLLLAQVELTSGNLKAAIKRAESAAVFEPSNPVTHFQVGVLRYEDKNIAGAGEAFAAAVQLAPDYANAHYYLGRVYFDLGQKDNAIKEFQQVLKLNPDNTDVQSVLATIAAGNDPFAPPKKAK